MFSLHFRKSMYRLPDYADDNTPNTYSHYSVTVLANLQTMNVKNTISMVCIQPPSTGFLLIGKPLIGRKIPSPYLPPDHSVSYHMTKSWFRLWKIAQMSIISLFGVAFVLPLIKKVSRRNPVIANAEKLNVMY